MDSANRKVRCPIGHELEKIKVKHKAGYTCDKCSAQLPRGTTIWECNTCDYSLCLRCERELRVAGTSEEEKAFIGRDSAPPLAASSNQSVGLATNCKEAAAFSSASDVAAERRLDLVRVSYSNEAAARLAALESLVQQQEET